MEVDQGNITAEDVEKAFNQIFRRGKLKPSQKDILAELKRGSETTIRQYLNQLYQIRLNPEREDPMPVPVEIRADFTQLWEKACTLAKNHWHEERHALHIKVAQNQQAREAALQSVDASKAEHKAVVDQFDKDRAQQEKVEQALQQQIQQMQQDLDREREAIAELEALWQVERTHVTALRKTLDTLKSDHQQQCLNEQIRFTQIEDSLHRKIDETRQEKKQLDQMLKQINLDYQNLQKNWLVEQDRRVSELQQVRSQWSETQQQLELEKAHAQHLQEDIRGLEQSIQSLEQQAKADQRIQQEVHDTLIRERTLSSSAQNQVGILSEQLERVKANLVQERMKRQQYQHKQMVQN